MNSLPVRLGGRFDTGLSFGRRRRRRRFRDWCRPDGRGGFPRGLGWHRLQRRRRSARGGAAADSMTGYPWGDGGGGGGSGTGAGGTGGAGSGGGWGGIGSGGGIAPLGGAAGAAGATGGKPDIVPIAGPGAPAATPVA